MTDAENRRTRRPGGDTVADAGNGRTRRQPQDAPAHGHGRRRGAAARGAPDRHSLVRRLPAIVLIAGAVAAAVAVDEARGVPGDDRSAAVGMRPDTIMPASPPARLGSSTWYCAAGTAEEDGMADHTVVMTNPTDGDLRARVTVSTGDVTGQAPAGGTGSDGRAGGRPVVAQVRLPAGERAALRLADLVEAPLAAALVEVDGGEVAVEHRVAGPHGSDVAPCATAAASTWHFAWGSTTRDAREVVVLYNPFPSSATVDAVFTTEDGWREPVRLQGLPVPGGSVVGVEVGDDVTRSGQVSATFEARSGRVVVERLQQYDGSLGVRGLSLALGAPAPQQTWVFADGEASAPAPTTPDPAAGADADETSDDADADGAESGDRDGDVAESGLRTSERIVVYNPTGERAEVDVTVVPAGESPGPPPQPFGLSIGAGAYEVVDYGEQARIAPGDPHATIVQSTNGQAVVAEQVTADVVVPAGEGGGSDDDGRDGAGGDDGDRGGDRLGEITAVAGSRLAAPSWTFPSVAGSADGGHTVSFVVFNPDSSPAVEAQLRLLPDDRSGPADAGPVAPVEVPPGARVAIEVDAAAAAAAGAAVVTADGPVVVDRVVRHGDGRRLAAGPGVPGAGEAVMLGSLLGDHGPDDGSDGDT